MNYSVTRKCRCFQMICWCWEAQLLSKKKKKSKKKFVCRPATPSFHWSRSRRRLAFILGRNRWLNMTGRKWESEAGDASRYCQITRRMRQISLFLHLVLVISLASFSSLISPVWRYVVVVVVGRGGRCLINLALTMRMNYLKQQCYPNLSLPGYRWIWNRELTDN